MRSTMRMQDLWLALVALVVFVGARCAPAQSPSPDITPVPGADCVVACKHLATNQCEEGRPTEEGAPCTEVCANGMADRYDLACVAGIPACDLVPCERPSESSE